jgi:glucosylceramidase
MKQTIIAAISLIASMTAPSQGTCADSQSRVEIYLTARDTGQRLAKSGEIGFNDKLSPTEKDEEIFVDPSKTFQTVLGIGGALTDASAETFYKLPKDKQQEILRAYYDPQSGIGYSLGRTHIHSCDFSMVIS